MCGLTLPSLTLVLAVLCQLPVRQCAVTVWAVDWPEFALVSMHLQVTGVDTQWHDCAAAGVRTARGEREIQQVVVAQGFTLLQSMRVCVGSHAGQFSSLLRSAHRCEIRCAHPSCSVRMARCGLRAGERQWQRRDWRRRSTGGCTNHSASTTSEGTEEVGEEDEAGEMTPDAPEAAEAERMLTVTVAQ